jgi:transcriptional regulator
MFVLPPFAVADADVLVDLVRTAGFGHLVVHGDDGLASTPLPFVVDDALSTVRAHVARPNPIWQLAPREALLIVPVTDAYVSPSWYVSKAQHGKVVPTWNYEVVHLHGRLVAHDDPEWVDRQIRDLTDTNEATQPTPWAVDDAPADFVASTRRGIVGLELEVTDVVGKQKLSQNRPAGDVDGTIAGLRSQHTGRSSAVADAMANHR